MYKLDLERAEETEIKMSTSFGSQTKQENSRKKEKKKNYFSFINYVENFDCVNHNKLWKILKEMGIPDHFTCLLRNLYVGKKQQLDWDMV